MPTYIQTVLSLPTCPPICLESIRGPEITRGDLGDADAAISDRQDSQDSQRLTRLLMFGVSCPDSDTAFTFKSAFGGRQTAHVTVHGMMGFYAAVSGLTDPRILQSQPLTDG